MDAVEEDKLHVYKIPIPSAFIREPGKRGITVSLAYDPPVRSSRKEYLARTMWFDAIHGLTTDEVVKFCGKVDRKDAEEDPPELLGKLLPLRPTKQRSQWSTLQVRRGEWTKSGSPTLRIVDGEIEPVLHIVVGCQRRFPTGLDEKQNYGLVVLFWHEGEEVRLYQSLRERVKLRASRVRIGG
jgi:hypothetical protein